MPDAQTTDPAQGAASGNDGQQAAGTQQQQGQAPNNTASATQGNGNGQGNGQGSFLDSLPPEAQEYVKQLRGEAASYRTRLRETEQRVQEFEDRDRTETERAVARAEKAERELAEARAEGARATVAAKFGKSPEQVALLRGDTAEELEKAAKALWGDPSEGEGDQSHRGDQRRGQRSWGQGARGTRVGSGGAAGMNEEIRRRISGVA